MKYNELQEEVSKYVYSEDHGMTRIALASIVATRMKLGDPIWLLIIGPASSGKSQVLRPLALTDTQFIHRVDDLTENTLMSGAKVKAGQKDISLLNTIGPRGIIVISDFTVIFSKSSETKAAILGQLRMVYDGEMIKYSGNTNKPMSWKGALGILAGSTPAVYTHMEEVADMGERFIYYRMKDYDVEHATRTSLKRTMYGKELDTKLGKLYEDYIKDCVSDSPEVPGLTDEVYEKIVQISMFAALLQTPIHYDKFQRVVDKIPVSPMPMRIALQLSAIARGLMVMRYYDEGTWDLSPDDITYIEWCAYSLANEERRACLRTLAALSFGDSMNTQTIADKIGLGTTVVGVVLQHLAAIGILTRSGSGDGLNWSINHLNAWEIIRKLENIEDELSNENRKLTNEEMQQDEEFVNRKFDAI